MTPHLGFGLDGVHNEGVPTVFQQYPTSTDCFKFSFFPRTIPVWNRLPAAAAEAPSLVCSHVQRFQSQRLFCLQRNDVSKALCKRVPLWYHSRGRWGALPSKWGFPPGHEVNLNEGVELCHRADCNYTSHFYFFSLVSPLRTI